MQGLVLVEVDGENMSDAELRPVAELLTAVNAEWAPNDPEVTTARARAEMHSGDETRRKHRVLALLGDRVVGRATIDFHFGTNEQIAEVYLDIHPSFCRRGIGTDLLARGVAIARAQGRSSLATWGPRTDASLAFWDRYALPEVQIDRTSRVQMADIDPDLMHRWRAECAGRAEGYVLHSWVNPCPDELMPLYVATQQGMLDAPLDDLDMTQPSFDEEWSRARERSTARRNGSLRTIAAVSPDGEPAGMTEITLWDHSPWFIQQQGTSTLAAHRNRGIGRWLKAEMFDQIQRLHPAARVIETGNADSNGPMLSINDQMGFLLFMQLTTRQADIAAVEAALGTMK